jgi:hypothetical protein
VLLFELQQLEAQLAPLLSRARHVVGHHAVLR